MIDHVPWSDIVLSPLQFFRSVLDSISWKESALQVAAYVAVTDTMSLVDNMIKVLATMVVTVTASTSTVTSTTSGIDLTMSTNGAVQLRLTLRLDHRPWRDSRRPHKVLLGCLARNHPRHCGGFGVQRLAEKRFLVSANSGARHNLNDERKEGRAIAWR